MKHFLVFSFFLIVSGLQSQGYNYIISSSSRIWEAESISKNATTRIQTSNPILDAQIDTIHEVLYLVLDNLKNGKPLEEGVLLAYDLKSKTEMWTREMKTSMETFRLLDTIPSISTDTRTEIFHRDDGHVLKRYSGSIRFLASSSKIGIAKYGSGATSGIIGLDMFTTESLWERRTPIEVGVSDMVLMGDTTLSFLSSGLQLINVENGKGFYENLKISYPASGYVTFAGGIGGIIGGMISAAIVGGIGSAHSKSMILVGSQQKNWILDSSGVYLANQKELKKLDFRGNTIWRNPMPGKAKTVGLSKLFFRDNDVFMVNNGIQYDPNSGTVYGPMFAARMDTETGGIKAYLDIKTEKREYMNDYLVKENSLLFALNERILEVDIENFETINERKFNTGSTKLGLKNIVSPPYYLKSDSVFFNPLEVNPKSFYIENSVGMKIEFSEEYELKAVVKRRDFYFQIQTIGDYNLIGNGTERYLINSDGESINSLTYSQNARVVGGYFVDFKDNEIILTPVSELGE